MTVKVKKYKRAATVAAHTRRSGKKGTRRVPKKKK